MKKCNQRFLNGSSCRWRSIGAPSGIDLSWCAAGPALLALSGGVPSSMALADEVLNICCCGRVQVTGGSCGCPNPCKILLSGLLVFLTPLLTFRLQALSIFSGCACQSRAAIHAGTAMENQGPHVWELNFRHCQQSWEPYASCLNGAMACSWGAFQTGMSSCHSALGGTCLGKLLGSNSIARRLMLAGQTACRRGSGARRAGWRLPGGQRLGSRRGNAPARQQLLRPARTRRSAGRGRVKRRGRRDGRRLWRQQLREHAIGAHVKIHLVQHFIVAHDAEARPVALNRNVSQRHSLKRHFKTGELKDLPPMQSRT